MKKRRVRSPYFTQKSLEIPHENEKKRSGGGSSEPLEPTLNPPMVPIGLCLGVWALCMFSYF